jgi:colicin import membrane protein
MRTALILAYNAKGVAQMISGPEVAFGEQRERWDEVTRTDEHDPKVARYELWDSERGQCKQFVPAEHNAAAVQATEKFLALKAEEKKKIALARKQNPAIEEDPKVAEARAQRIAAKAASDKEHGITRTIVIEEKSSPAVAVPIVQTPAEGTPERAAWDEQRRLAAEEAARVEAEAKAKADAKAKAEAEDSEKKGNKRR